MLTVNLGCVTKDEVVGHDMTQGSVESARKVPKIAASMKKSFEHDGGVSVNRVSEAERLGTMEDLELIALSRGTHACQEFQGWAKTSVLHIENSEYKVKAKPTGPKGSMLANPYHALIYLPSYCGDDAKQQRVEIKRLAQIAAKCWHVRPFLVSTTQRAESVQ